MDDSMLNMPIFYAVFKKPTQRMVSYLKEIREKLQLPLLEPGLEPNPGQWGLFTPGYYIFALHFRMIPLGFEPLSVMLNEANHLQQKLDDLMGFWETARKLAKQAKSIAECRNESLLIYFATDDAANLRSEATEKLSSYGRVIFGPSVEEVGHMSPQWTETEEREVNERIQSVWEKKEAAAAAEAGGCEGGGADPGTCKSRSGPPPPSDLMHRVSVVSPARTAEATRRHTDMSLVEWWILANAQWLATTRYSSFPVTSGAWGLGPGGRMERMEVHGRPVFRIDWARGDCAPARAADPGQAATCPNLELP
jgi:hypothetical protein